MTITPRISTFPSSLSPRPRWERLWWKFIGCDDEVLASWELEVSTTEMTWRNGWLEAVQIGVWQLDKMDQDGRWWQMRCKSLEICWSFVEKPSSSPKQASLRPYFLRGGGMALTRVPLESLDSHDDPFSRKNLPSRISVAPLFPNKLRTNGAVFPVGRKKWGLLNAPVEWIFFIKNIWS